MTKVKKKGDTVTVYNRDPQHHTNMKGNKKLLRVEDNGNGFTVKYYAWSSISPDMYYNIPYDMASDLVDALEKFDYRDIL